MEDANDPEAAFDRFVPSPTAETASVPRILLRSVRRDPHHLPEILIALAHSRLSETAWQWAQDSIAEDPGRSPSGIAEAASVHAQRFARINGAVAGTPFFIAFVPAYVSVLWREAYLAMAIAALNGTDPRTDDFPARMLVLRGVHPDAERAQAALDELGTKPSAEEPGLRARMQLLYTLLRRVLVLGGFLSVPDDEGERPGRIRQAFGLFAAGVVWMITCIAPLTFMMLMAWSCERDMRNVADLAIEEFSSESRARKGARERLRGLREARHGIGLASVARWLVVAVTLAVPMGLLTWSVTHQGGDGPVYTVSALAGLSLVLALWARAPRS